MRSVGSDNFESRGIQKSQDARLSEVLRRHLPQRHRLYLAELLPCLRDQSVSAGLWTKQHRASADTSLQQVRLCHQLASHRFAIPLPCCIALVPLQGYGSRKEWYALPVRLAASSRGTCSE